MLVCSAMGARWGTAVVMVGISICPTSSAVMPDSGRERSRISPTSHAHYAVAACPRARRMHTRGSGLVCMRGGGNSRALPSRIWQHWSSDARIVGHGTNAYPHYDVPSSPIMAYRRPHFLPIALHTSIFLLLSV